MMNLRPSDERGHANYGWLDTRHSFSFANYYDPAHMGFRALRVINEDRVGPGGGFPPHPHQDMEILTYVLEGGLAHKDSMGNTSVIQAGEAQYMCAGTGVMHSEYNASDAEPVKFFQIWVLPDKAGYPPGYDQRFFRDAIRGGLTPIASGDGREGSLKVHQDLSLYAAILEAGQSGEHALASGRHAWVQLASGSLRVNGTLLGPGDGLAVSDEAALRLDCEAEAELLLFDLP